MARRLPSLWHMLTTLTSTQTLANPCENPSAAQWTLQANPLSAASLGALSAGLALGLRMENPIFALLSSVPVAQFFALAAVGQKERAGVISTLATMLPLAGVASLFL